MDHMNRVVDQQKSARSSLDDKMIPLTCESQISVAWKSHGWDKQQYTSDHWLYDLGKTIHNISVPANKMLLGQIDRYYVKYLDTRDDT